MRNIYIVFLISCICVSISFPLQGQNQEATKPVIKNELAIKQKELKKMQAELSKLTNNVKKLETTIKDMTTPDKSFSHTLFSYANLAQAQFVNWLAGGENSISFVLGTDYGLKYEDKPNKILWDSKVSGMVGFRNDKTLGLVKANDFFNVNSTFSYAFLPKIAVATDFSLRTQLLPTNNYKNADNPVLASSFFAPASINVGVGAKWIPAKWFSAYLSPLTSQMTIVANPVVDPRSFGVDSGQRIRMEAGWYVNAEANLDLFQSVLSINMRSILFQNYIDPRIDNGIDVDLRMKIDAKISKYFTATLFMNMRYDVDAQIKTTVVENGESKTTYRPANVQFLENFGIGFSYKIAKTN